MAWDIASDVPSTSPSHGSNSGAHGESCSTHTYAFKHSCTYDSCNTLCATRRPDLHLVASSPDGSDGPGRQASSARYSVRYMRSSSSFDLSSRANSVPYVQAHRSIAARSSTLQVCHAHARSTRALRVSLQSASWFMVCARGSRMHTASCSALRLHVNTCATHGDARPIGSTDLSACAVGLGRPSAGPMLKRPTSFARCWMVVEACEYIDMDGPVTRDQACPNPLAVKRVAC